MVVGVENNTVILKHWYFLPLSFTAEKRIRQCVVMEGFVDLTYFIYLCKIENR
jgi:hypothetical protein